MDGKTNNKEAIMAKEVKVESVIVDGEDKKGNPVYVANGTLNELPFVARTIQYNGEPIFKVQEDGAHRKMEGSQFGRGDRIAVARVCKAMRLEVFGTGAKEKVEPDLDAGETVEIKAEAE